MDDNGTAPLEARRWARSSARTMYRAPTVYWRLFWAQGRGISKQSAHRERLPCFNGVCEYPLPSDNGSSSESTKIVRIS
ncbi:hypothetical protein BDZ89DRAFT_1077661 [Hymenopellis radicata]|nr:hypothetical protein BDZ89DRAFT_1077661 [Hymenopellis radicata]